MAHDEIPDWVTGWNEYRRTLDEDAEERAYEAGFRRGRAKEQDPRIMELDRRHREPVPGSIQWALEQLQAGRSVKRKHVGGLLSPHASVSHHVLTFGDVMATDWQLVETPDSPCDSP